MKKVLLLPFLVLFLACTRTINNNETSSPITIIDTTTVATKKYAVEPVEIGKVKVYLENTLSMYGYLPYQGKGGVITDFRNTVNQILRASKNTYRKENVELFLINNTIITSINIDNNLGNIDENKLKSQYSKGNGSSDFDQLFKEIIKDWNKDEVIVFIADFIYSPKGRDPKSGLEDFRGEITDAFQNASNGESLSVNILHLESDFYGKYYDIDDIGHNGIDNRPYYVFIIGDERNVREYSAGIVPQIEKYKLKNEYNLSPSETKIDNYSALPFTLNIGQFKAKDSHTNGSQIKAVTIKNSLKNSANVQLAIAVNLRDVPVSHEYLMDIDNYQLDNEIIEIKNIGLVKNKKIELNDGTSDIIKPNDIPKAGNASHVFLLSFPATYKGSIELSLKKDIPDWVKDVSIKDGKDDRDIQTNILKQSQTFGFNYIVEGIYNAQRLKSPTNQYFQITLDIDQEKSSSGIGTILGWLIGLGIIGIIIFIIIRNKQRK